MSGTFRSTVGELHAKTAQAYGVLGSLECDVGAVPEAMQSFERAIAIYEKVGAPGDVTVIEVVEGPVEFVDTRNNKRTGKAYIKPVNTVAAGAAFGRPFAAPFSVR